MDSRHCKCGWGREDYSQNVPKSKRPLVKTSRIGQDVGSDLGIYVILRWTMVELGIPNSKT